MPSPVCDPTEVRIRGPWAGPAGGVPGRHSSAPLPTAFVPTNPSPETIVNEKRYPRRPPARSRPPQRGPCTFWLDASLVERARREVGESDVVRSIEAALAAALDYQSWVREVAAGQRDPVA